MTYLAVATLGNIESIKNVGEKPFAKSMELSWNRTLKRDRPMPPTGKRIFVISHDKKTIEAVHPWTTTNHTLATIAGGQKHELFTLFNQAEAVVVVDTLDSAWSRAVGRSMPPTRRATLSGVVSQSLRGTFGVGTKVSAFWSERTRQQSTFGTGKHILALSKARGGVRVTKAVPATEATLAIAAAAASMPVGQQTGPVLLCGEGITMTVTKVAPAKAIKWTNGDGDGEYRITITNTNKKAVTVGALLSDNGKTNWLASLRVGCQGKFQQLPGTQDPISYKGTTLQAGQSVEFVVNALTLKDITWPRGGYRVEFRFCIGELSVTKSFYYMSRHHDKKRAEAVAKTK